jgi:hypothetical protein
MPDREGILFLLPASCTTNHRSFVSLQLIGADYLVLADTRN